MSSTIRLFTDKDPGYASKNALSGMNACLSSSYIFDLLSALNNIIFQFGGKLPVDVASLSALEADNAGITMATAYDEEDEPKIYLQDGQLMSTSPDEDVECDVKIILVDNATSSDYYELTMENGNLATTKIDDMWFVQTQTIYKWIEIEDNNHDKYKLFMDNGDLKIQSIQQLTEEGN